MFMIYVLDMVMIYDYYDCVHWFFKISMAFLCPGAESRLGQQRLRPAPEPCQERPVAQAAQTLAGTSNLPFPMGMFMVFSSDFMGY